MRLSVKLLKNVDSINSFEFTDVLYAREDQTNTLSVMLCDQDRAGLRYVSPELPADLSLVAVFPSINSEKIYTIDCTLLNPDDKSIWQIVLPADKVPASGAIKFIYTENLKVSKFVVPSAISVEMLSIGNC